MIKVVTISLLIRELLELCIKKQCYALEGVHFVNHTNYCKNM